MDSFLPEADRDYLGDKQFKYTEVLDGGQRGVVLHKWPLPAGKFSASEVELLVLIPNGYRDTPLDMFYVLPNLTLTSEGKIAKAADQPLNFDGKIWQRWSRHLPPSTWRPGIDGLHTFLLAIQRAFAEAKA